MFVRSIDFLEVEGIEELAITFMENVETLFTVERLALWASNP